MKFGDCNEYMEEIQSIGGRLEPHTDAAALGNMLYETFRASFDTRSFRCAQDEFGEESAILREWYTNLRPIGLQSLTAWLEKRRAPKRRKHMEQLLEQYGCVGLEGFLRVTHALSAASSKVRKKAPEK